MRLTGKWQPLRAGSGHACLFKDGRIDDHNVGHGQERGHPGQDFCAPIGAKSRKLKIAFEGRDHIWVSSADHSPAGSPSLFLSRTDGAGLLQGSLKDRIHGCLRPVRRIYAQAQTCCDSRE